MLQRTVEYAHLTHKLSGREVDYFNTHLCLCNGDQLLGSAVTIADTIAAHRRAGSRIILTGDFNCDDGGEQSKPVRSVNTNLNLLELSRILTRQGQSQGLRRRRGDSIV